jgi:peroxiredoxin Q/BCP
MCSLRDAGKLFEDLGVTVHGISLDSVADQAKFVKQEELNFALLSDPDGSAAAKYQVLPGGQRYTSRVTFVIDPKGVLRHIEREVDVAAHGSDLAKLIAKLQE